MASQVQRNLAYLIEQHELNSRSAAKLLGLSQPVVFRVIKGEREPNLDTVQTFAAHFGVTVDDLLTRDLTAGLPASAIARTNVREGPAIRGLVPLLTSVQAGEWCEIGGTFQREDAKMWLPCPVKHGPRTFCLVVEGESMRNPGGRPSYEPGDVIFVDPDVSAKPGDRIVAHLECQAAATFKQYLEEDGRKLLKALNPDWQPRYININDNTTICGVVIGKWVPE
jgi:SOS-response transcriptional repressor LexA